MAVTFNLADVTTLALDAPTLAKIFNGTITRWNDPAITRLNQSMPSQPITVVYRTDESGTSRDLPALPGGRVGRCVGQGANRTWNGASARALKAMRARRGPVNNTDGAISYNEWSFAQAQNLEWVDVVTSAGKNPVRISAESVGKTIAGAKVAVSGNDLELDTSSFYKPTEAGAYPIVLTTYELVCSKYPDAEVGTAVKAFLQSTIGGGQAGLADHGYVPLPEDFQSKVESAVNAIA